MENVEMRQVRLGGGGPQVSEMALGCMGMSGGYGRADDAESIATIHAALEAGITMFDTGDFYGAGHNEMLIREALAGGKRERAFIAVKFGALRSPDLNFLGDDGRPNSVKNFLAYSLRRLGTDYVDLYQPARLDPTVPIEDTIGAIADMVKAGYVRHVGLSEVSAKSIRRAHAVHPIAALQTEYSLLSRDIEKDILPTIRELGIALVAYGVLSRGLISDGAQASREAGEIRTRMPRFAAENFPRNLALVRALAAIAREKNASTAQLAFAWMRARGDDVVTLVGARRRDQLSEAVGALAVTLTSADLARIGEAVPAEAVAGTRYLPAVLAHMDSEQPS
jgi:aryl-alcohol dehydrogenase-like predicted oxidoreductase